MNEHAARRSGSGTIGAAEAAARLQVKLETIYAYVSRGLLTRLEGSGKLSRFDVAQVERLAARGRAAGKRERRRRCWSSRR